MKWIITALSLFFALQSFTQANIRTVKPIGERTYPNVTGSYSLALTKELNVGNKVPDVLIQNLRNSNTQQIKLSDLRGKLVIIDFWATWCTSCRKSMLKLDSFQKEFKDKIQVITITSENKALADKFFLKKPFDKISLVGGSDDRLLELLFRHQFLPHQVWINEQGYVLAVPDPEEVTREKISHYLTYGTLDIKAKIDLLQYNKKLPLLTSGIDTSLINLQYSSIFANYIDGLGSMQSFGPKLTFTNTYIQYLFMYSLSESPYTLGRNRTILNARDSSLFFYWERKPLIKTEAWKKRTLFCYELIVPEQLQKQQYKIMYQDLSNYFGALYGITAKLEKRIVDCWVLTKGTADVVTKGRNRTQGTDNFGNAYFTNWPFSQVFDALNSSYWQDLEVPIINETGITGNVDFRIIPAGWKITREPSNRESAFRAVYKEMTKLGFKLTKQEKEIYMIVITQN